VGFISNVPPINVDFGNVPAIFTPLSSITSYKGGIIVATTNNWNAIVHIIVRDINKDLKKAVPSFKQKIRLLLRKIVPVRTGKLLDTMLNNLRVEIIDNLLHISTVLPSGYPISIINAAHVMGIGYGPKYTPTNTILNRAVLRETPKGAYYVLNDPSAEGNYSRILGTYALPVIRNGLSRYLNNYDVIISLPKHVPKGPYMGTEVVSGRVVTQKVEPIEQLEYDVLQKLAEKQYVLGQGNIKIIKRVPIESDDGLHGVPLTEPYVQRDEMELDPGDEWLYG